MHSSGQRGGANNGRGLLNGNGNGVNLLQQPSINGSSGACAC